MWPWNKKEEKKKVRSDAYVNNLTGFGNKSLDKLISTKFQASDILDDYTLEDMYHDNDIAAKIANIFPNEMTRKGFDLNVGRFGEMPEESDRIKSEITMKLKGLNSRDKVNEALIWARVFGGAVILMGVDDGRNVARPVNEAKIKGIRFLNVIDKRVIKPVKYFTDPLKENFGEPELYEIQSDVSFPAGNVSNHKKHLIHVSRLMVFEGTRTSQRRKTRNDGWSESIYQRMNEVLVQFSSSWQSTAHIMQDAAQAVFGINGMVDMISSQDPGTQGHPAVRMHEVDMQRSSARSIVIDAEEETFARDTYSFSGVPEVLQKFMLRLAAAADIPVSILMGQSPAGLNATGDADIRSFYDRVQSLQTNTLLPQIEKLVRYCLLSQEGPTNGSEPENWAISFPPPWQETERGMAEIRKMQAETDAVYIDRGVYTSEEVAISAFSQPGFHPERSINLEIREELVEEGVRDMIENDEELNIENNEE